MKRRQRESERQPAGPRDQPKIKPTSQHRNINCSPTLCLQPLLDPLVFPNKAKWGQLFPFPHSPIDCLLNRLAFEGGFISGSIKWAPKLTMNADFFSFASYESFSCVAVTEKESEGGADRYCLSLLLLGSDCRDVCFWWLTAPCRPRQ